MAVVKDIFLMLWPSEDFWESVSKEGIFQKLCAKNLCKVNWKAFKIFLEIIKAWITLPVTYDSFYKLRQPDSDRVSFVKFMSYIS